MTTPPHHWTAKDVVATTLVVVAVGLCFWLSYHATRALLLLFVALVLASAMRSPVGGLQRLGLRRTSAALTAHLIVLAMMIGLGLLVLPPVAEQTMSLIETLPEYYAFVRFQLLVSSSHLLETIGQVLPEQPWNDLRGGSREQPAALIPGFSQLLFPGAAVLFSMLAVFLVSFHWCIAGERTLHSALLLVPASRRQAVSELLDDIQQKLGAFVRGQLVLCGAVGSMAYVAYLWIGLPFAAVLAVVAGMLEAVPIVGPIVATVPAVVIGLTVDWETAAWVVAVNIVIAQVESYVLVPGIMKRAVGVHPIVSIVAISAMFALLGPIGAVLAIPSAAVLQTILQRLVFRRAEPSELGAQDDRSAAAVLRYRGHELLHDLRALSVERPAGNAADEGALSIDEILVRAERVVDDVLVSLRDGCQETVPSNGSRGEAAAAHATPMQTVRIAAMVGATLAVLVLLWALRGALALFVLAVVLCWTLHPLHAWLPARRLVRIPAIVAIYLGLLVIPLVAGYFVVPQVAANMERAVFQVKKLHTELPKRWGEATSLQQIVAERIARLDGTLADDPATHTVLLVGGALGWGGLLAATTINALLVVFLAAYWSVDRERFRRLWLSLLSGQRRSQVRKVWEAVESEVGAYLRREILLALLAATLVGSVFGAVRFPFATTLALITLAAWFVPWLGVALVLSAVWIAVGINFLSVTPVAALAQATVGSVVVLAVHAVLILLLRPRISDDVHVHPLSVLTMAVAMVALLGWWGLLLAPPMAVAGEAAVRTLRRMLGHVAERATGDLLTARTRLNELRDHVGQHGWSEDAPIRTIIHRVDALMSKAEEHQSCHEDGQ